MSVADKMTERHERKKAVITVSIYGNKWILENMVTDAQTSQEKRLEWENTEVKFNAETTTSVCKN